MKELVATCVKRAHETVRKNPVIIWFPILFSTTVWIFYLLLLMVVLMPHVPNLPELDAVTITQEMAQISFAPVLLLGVVAVLILLVQVAGTLGLQAKAVQGQENIETRHYFHSVRKLIIRVLGLQSIMLLLYAVPVALIFALFMSGAWGEALLAQDYTAALEAAAPLALLIPLVLTAVNVLFAVWPLTMALGDKPLLKSFRHGVSFAWRNIKPVALIIFGSWFVTSLARIFLDGFFLSPILLLVISFVARSYAALSLMYLYEMKAKD